MVSIVHAARDIGRLREISSVLMRHGFGEVVARLGLRARRGQEGSQPPAAIGGNDGAVAAETVEPVTPDQRELTIAVRLRQVLEELGPSFVKLGQIASTRADLLPVELITELRKLQDSVAPVPFAAVREQVEQSLGKKLEELFESFEETPLAAASIAQVHRARLVTDVGVAEVVVKVQRPSIADTMASDLDLLHMLAGLIERTMPETRSYSPSGLVAQFDRAIHDELDFGIEADNAQRFARNFAGFPGIRFPVVHKHVSGKRVLTLELFDGKRLDHATFDGTQRRAIVRIAVAAMVKQVFEDGFFHADPHPGNVIILGTPSAPELGLIDLGMVGRLSPRLRDLTLDLMVATLRQDYDGVVDALFAIGTPRQQLNVEKFRSEVTLLAERYLGRSLGEIQVSALMRDLVHLCTTYGLEVPVDFILVGKAMMTIEGIGKQIDPELDIMEEARPHFLALVKRRYSPERLGMEFVRRTERLADATANLPNQLGDLLRDARLGRIRLVAEDPNQARAMDRLGRRVLAGCVVAGGLLAGGTCLAHDNLHGGLALLGMSGLWLLGHLAGDLRRHFGKHS